MQIKKANNAKNSLFKYDFYTLNGIIYAIFTLKIPHFHYYLPFISQLLGIYLAFFISLFSCI